MITSSPPRSLRWSWAIKGQLCRVLSKAWIPPSSLTTLTQRLTLGATSLSMQGGLGEGVGFITLAQVSLVDPGLQNLSSPPSHPGVQP